MTVLTGFSVTGIYLGIPLTILLLSDFSAIIRRISPIVLCYAVGIILGRAGVMGPATRPVFDVLSGVMVALSIPLMLFSVDVRRWRTLTGKAGLSMTLAFISIVIVSLTGYLLFATAIPEGWKIAGLLVGVYTGGTPNLAAIQAGLGVEYSTYLAVHTSDVILGAFYLLFIITIAKKIISKILPSYRSGGGTSEEIPVLSLSTIKEMLSPGKRLPLAGAIALAVLIIGVGAFAGELVPGTMSMAVTILVITTLSLAAALFPRIRSIDMTLHLGEYVILVFCTVVGSLTDPASLASSIPQVFFYVTWSIFASTMLHILLCRLFSIDVDTMLVTSASAILSPPFVTMVAVSLRNREVIVAGITTGIIGYAAGNYLGILTARFAGMIG